MATSEPRSTATLPPVTLTPEEAAAVAVALAAQPDHPYAAAGRAALQKVLAVLEPDGRRRAQLLATSLRVSAEAGRSAGRGRHPAGRALRRRPDPADPRRGLVVLPGGRADS